VSGANGAYRVALIPPGVYDVSVELQVRRQTRKNVEVAINQQTTLDFSMAVGGRSEMVVVEAEIPLVEVSAPPSRPRVAADDRRAAAQRRNTWTHLARAGRAARARRPAGRERLDFGERGIALQTWWTGREQRPLNGVAAVRYTGFRARIQVSSPRVQAESGRPRAASPTSSRARGTVAGAAFTSSNDALTAQRAGPGPAEAGRYQWGGTVSGPLARPGHVLGSFEVLDETRGVNMISQDPGLREERPRHRRQGDFGIGPPPTAGPAC
jgi:hypothetical protein